jgi:hypothetical protein
MQASYSDLSGNALLVPTLDLRGTERMVPAMRTQNRKDDDPSDWRLTMEQIGRELRKAYGRPERLPRRLRALVTRLRNPSLTEMMRGQGRERRR